MKENKFPENLKSLRKSYNLSQQDLADKINVSKQTISKYEKGIAEPNFHTLIEVSRTFNCSLDDLVFDSVKITSKSPIELNLILDKKINKFKNDILFSINDFFEYELDSTQSTDIIETDINDTNNNNSIKHIIENNDNSEYNTEIADELSPVVSLNEYKLNKDSIDVDFYNDNGTTIIDASPFPTEETVKIFGYGSVAAGIPIFGENIIENHFNIFKYELKYDDDEYFSLKVNGESMNKLYKHDDYLLVRKTCDFDEHTPVIIFLDDEATVKFIKFTDDTVTLIPCSTESQFEPIDYNKQDFNYYIAGTVVGVINKIKDK